MRPQPAHVIAQILAPFAATLAPDIGGRRIAASVRRVIKPPVVFPAFCGVIESTTLVVLDESAISPVRGARSFGRCEPLTHAR